jgi:hypothetical protein
VAFSRVSPVACLRFRVIDQGDARQRVDHPLDDSYLKVQRATEQLEALDADMLSVGRANPIAQEETFDILTGERGLRIHPPKWPPRWSIEVGEIAHNLRSALDYAAFQISDCPEEKRTEFPIGLDQENYFKATKRRGKQVTYRDRCIRGVDPKWAAWIDQLQGFNSPHPTKELLLLNSLSNRDKHRVQPVIQTTLEYPAFNLIVADGNLVDQLDLKFASNGRVKLEPLVRGPRAKGNRKVVEFQQKRRNDGKHSVGISFGPERVAIYHLGAITRYVEFILASLSPAFD